jgi:DNA-binding transcriptional LysR family regulator
MTALLTSYARLAAIAEHEGFGKAAAVLGVSVPTLSQTMRSLEARLGVRLLNRTTRCLRLTTAGEQLLGQVRPALEQLSFAVERLMSSVTDRRAPLRLVALQPASSGNHVAA